MNKVYLSSIFSLILGINACKAAEKPEAGIYLFTAKVTNAKLVHKNSGFRSDGIYVDSPSTYEFVLTGIKVEQGPSQKFAQSLTLQADVRDDYPFLTAPQVFVMLEKSATAQKVLYIGVVSRIACIPKGLVSSGYASSYAQRGDLSCVAIDDQYQPATD